MRYLIIILLCFFASSACAQVPVIQRGSSAQVLLDQRLMTGQNFYLPRVVGVPQVKPSVLNGGVDTLGAKVFNILDSCEYHYVGGNLWEKDLTFRDTVNAVTGLATKADIANNGHAVFGQILGSVSNQVNLYDSLLNRPLWVDTLLGFIATPFYVNNQGFLKTETDPIATAKTITQTGGYGIFLSNSGSPQAIGINPAFTFVVDTTKIIPYTDTLKGFGIATKGFLQKNYLPISDTGKGPYNVVTGGYLNFKIDSIALNSGVTSFNTRVGAVISQTGDYAYTQVSNAAGLPANQNFTGANIFFGGTSMYSALVLKGISVGTSGDSILTISGGVVREIPAISATFLTFADTGRCPTCIVNGGSLNKTIDSIIVAGTAGVSSFNTRVGAVVPQSGDYSYSLLSGNGSTSITTLGTINTGVWNGSQIANAYLVNSSINFGLDNTTTNISWSASSAPLGGNITLHVPAAGTGITLGAVSNSSQTIAGVKTFTNGVVLGATSTPGTDSAVDLGSSSLRFDNLYTALPAYSSGVYVLAVENYSTKRLEALPYSALPIDTTRVVHLGAGLWTVFGSNDTLYAKNLQAGSGITIAAQADSSLLISASIGAITINNVVTVTGAYSANNLYPRTTIIVNATSATVTLPDPTQTGNQNKFYYIRTQSSGQTATVGTAAGQIETSVGVYGSTTSVSGIALQGFISNGTNWILTD